jgi:methionyl-tRNA formyltransferase
MAARIVFMGSPEFALPTLQALSDHYPVVGVVTQPDRPAGRGRTLTPPPVKVLAEELGLHVIQPESLRDPGTMARLREWNADIFIVAAFGQILNVEVLDLPPFGSLNVHASLLPRWRGAAPIQAAILHGDEQTGVTIMKMDTGIDTGPLLSQRVVPIQAEDNAGTLSVNLAQTGADLLIDTLPAYLSGDLHPQPQQGEHSYAPMLKKSDGRLDFTQSAAALERKIRAYDPWPGTFMIWQSGQMKILKAHEVGAANAKIGSHMQPGHRTTFQDNPAIFTGKGLLILEELQPAGKKPMAGKVFLRGARDWVE